MDLTSLVSPRHRSSTQGSIERPRFPMTLLVAVIGILLAVTAFFTFGTIDSRLHSKAVAGADSAIAADDSSIAPATFLVRAGSTRAKVDQIAVTDAKIM